MSNVLEKIDSLKAKQDIPQINFGMVGMGHVLEIFDEYEAELWILKVEKEKLLKENTELQCANALKELEEKLKVAETCLAEAKSVLDHSLIISPHKNTHMSIARTLVKIRREQKDTDNE